LESSRDELQEYVIKCRRFHLKNWKWPSRDLQVTIQGQTNDTILCPPWNHTTFVWETSFSKIKNKKVIWDGTLKWDTLYALAPWNEDRTWDIKCNKGPTTWLAANLRDTFEYLKLRRSRVPYFHVLLKSRKSWKRGFLPAHCNLHRVCYGSYTPIKYTCACIKYDWDIPRAREKMILK